MSDHAAADSGVPAGRAHSSTAGTDTGAALQQQRRANNYVYVHDGDLPPMIE